MKDFIRHPKGFKIFLHPENVTESDEYLSSDPYTVATNIDSEFHKRRVELTTELVETAVSSLVGTPKVLDLGCGQGHITEKLRQSKDSLIYFGLDYSVSAIEYAHDNFPQIEFLVADAYSPPFDSEFFDVIVCNNLWEHVEDPLALLRGIRRILKPGGHLIMSTPSRYRLGNLLRVLRGLPVVFMSKFHVTEYSVGQIVEQLQWGGFEIRTILSRRISAGSMKRKFAKLLVSIFIKIVGSGHQLESTIFYLAQKRVPFDERST